MEFEYRDYELSNAIIDIAAGPFGSNLKVSCFTETGFPIIDGANLKGITVTDNITKFVSEDKARSLHRSIAKRRDIVVTISGNVGQISYIPDNSQYAEYLCSQRQFRVTFDESKIYVPYLVYYLHSVEGRSKILAFANQTGVPALSQPLKNFRKIKIDLPSLENQHKIADILSTLDEKIAINRAINDNLLEQALTLYSTQFSTIERNGCIGDYCSIKSGFAFKSSWWTHSGVKVIKIGSINQDNLNLLECSYVDNDKIEKAKDFKVGAGDLLIAMTGATIGKFAMVPYSSEILLVNQRVGKFFLGDNPVKKLPFIYCTLKQPEVYSEVVNRGQGSAQPNISASDIMSIPCVIPSQGAINSFNDTTQPLFNLIISNQRENQQLSKLRDTLLSKLMSGEIDVSAVQL